MKKLLEFLLPICFHEWEVECKTNVYPFDPFDGLNAKTQELVDTYAEHIRSKYKKPLGIKYTLRCKKCGELKTYHDY
jgi:hypothetical protein